MTPVPSPATPLHRLLVAVLLGCALAVAGPAATASSVTSSVTSSAASPAAVSCSCQQVAAEEPTQSGPQPTGRPTREPEPTLEQLARSANMVFTGQVWATSTEERADDPGRTTHTHEVMVALVYKGRLRESVVEVRTTGGGACSLGALPERQPYVFLVENDDGVLRASGCGGTQPEEATIVAELEALYGAGTAPQPEQPAQEATIERVPGVGDPPSLTRAVAPGLAMVLVGLLGLVVVRRLGRRN